MVGQKGGLERVDREKERERKRERRGWIGAQRREIDGRTATPHYPRGQAGERSSVKPLIMPKQYTVGAPVSVADPRCSRLVPSKFRASNEFELESAPPN